MAASRADNSSQAQIYTYEASTPVYAMNWSVSFRAMEREEERRKMGREGHAILGILTKQFYIHEKTNRLVAQCEMLAEQVGHFSRTRLSCLW